MKIILRKISLLIKSLLLHAQRIRRISALDVTIFLRQLATLLTAGIPILQAFDILEKIQIKTAMRLLIYSIKRELLSGKGLYSSLRQHPLYFEELACQLIKIGEHTGRLDATLTLLADEHEKQYAFKKRIKQSLFYPLLITAISIIVSLSLFLFIVPRFSELFYGTSIKLPWLTIWIFFLSAKLQQYFYLAFLPLFFIILFFLPHSLVRKFKKNIRRYIFHLPFIRQIIQKIILAKFSRHLAMAFSAGIPLTDSLKLVMHAQSNIEFTQALAMLRSKIHSGLQLHQAMQSLAYFPDLMIQMVKIGEDSGTLDHLLNKVAGFFEADIDQLFEQCSRLLEPLIILVLGVLIGGLVIGMYLPIFKLGSVL